ncbi:BACON domain-containing protein [Anaeromyxobacter terrae]|uniref:BACON domain-containing protein n=1 Tax=Anaeromyxobacter terrae TaxID=2925406 RepID=UPI001F5A9748|nr:hypothetical protein [Anaeromyxobacter sp. SG22]
MAPNPSRGRAWPAALGAAVLAVSVACSGGSDGGNTGGGGTLGGGGYSLEVAPTALAFAADQNATTPAAKTLTARFVGDGLVVGYPPGVSAPSWLSVSVATSTASSATLSVRVSTTSLAPGAYRTTVRLVTGKQDGSSVVWKDVPVEYVVSAGLQASATSLSFSAFDGVAPAAKTITLTSDVLPKAWTLAVESSGGAPSDWVVLPATSGTLASASADVQVEAAPRPPGTYHATLVVKDGAGASRARIYLTYQVAPAFTLSGTLTTRVTEAATLASLDLPLALHTQLDAATGASRAWQATSTADWLSVIPASGDLAADASLVVRLDPAKLWALANGPYTATITIATTQGGATTASVPVSLTVALSPALTAPPTVSWSIGVAATSADLARTAAVSSNLGEAFAGHGDWHATTPAAWLQVTPSSAADGGNLTLAVPVSALAGLANGAQVGTVALTADDARVAGATVQASVNISLPDVTHVAPYTTWAGRAPAVILRGSGFGAGGTLPVLLGPDTVTGTVVSDTEIRVQAPLQAAAGRVPVSIANSFGVARATSELVVLADPGYASVAASLPLTNAPTKMTLDPERQAVLLFGGGPEIRRLRFASGTWTQDTFQAPNVTGAYVPADGKTLLVTSGYSGSPAQIFYELDPVTLAVIKQTSYPAYNMSYSIAAGLNDGRVLVINSDQFARTIWYPSLTSGVYVSAYHPIVLVTRDRSRIIVDDDGTYGMSSYDVADVAFRSRPIGADPWGSKDWSVSGDGGRLAVDAAVYDRDFNLLGMVSLPEPGVRTVAVSPDGATLYTLAFAQNPTTSAWYWTFRRTDIAGAPPYTTDATALPFAIASNESPYAMAVSEDGSTLFLLTHTVSTSVTTTAVTFRAFPLK